jgi:hypothetical protein
MLLKWKYPFDDGVVIDRFEVGVVQLPDAFIPIAMAAEERDRRRAERDSMLTASDNNTNGSDGAEELSDETVSPLVVPTVNGADLESLVPVVHSAGHLCEYLVQDSAPYTAFRVRVRAHSMVGWGPWGQWSLVTTKRECCPCKARGILCCRRSVSRSGDCCALVWHQHRHPILRPTLVSSAQPCLTSTSRGVRPETTAHPSLGTRLNCST